MPTPRNIVIPVALSVGLAAVVIFFLFIASPDEDEDGGGDADEPAVMAPTPEPAAEPAADVEQPSVEPVRPSPQPAHSEPAPSTPAPAAPAPASAPSSARVAEPNQAPEPLTPEVRQHAKLMMTSLAQQALNEGDIAQLEELVKLTEGKKGATEQLVPNIDAEAIKLALGCLEGSPEAQKKATAFLQFGPRSQLDDGLRKACWEKLGKGQRGAREDSQGQGAQPATTPGQ